MIKKLILVIVCVLFSHSSFSQSTKSDIKEIRKNYKEVVKNKNSFFKKSQDLMGGSSEGGQAVAYFEEDIIRLIAISWYGEMGKTTRSYYYKNEKLFFIFEEIYTYNAPIYYDKETAKEDNSVEFFDDKKTTRLENRYYYKNNELIRVLDHAKKQQNLSLKDTKENGVRLLKEATDLKNKFYN
jgi:hypothetical protein